MVLTLRKHTGHGFNPTGSGARATMMGAGLEEELCITFQEALSLGLLEREPVLLPGPNDDGILTQLAAEDVAAS